MPHETPRSRTARAAAEQALVRVIHHYGDRPEFVLLGGLVADMLCLTSDVRHAGTTDVDVQVDLELELGSTTGSVHVRRGPADSEGWWRLDPRNTFGWFRGK